MKKTLLAILGAGIFSFSNANSQTSYEHSKIHQEMEYERTTERVIELSREQGYSLLVNKNERIAYLFRLGAVDTTFRIVLGPRPEGDKIFEGDGRTPEGLYTIIEKRDGINGRPSDFGLAFLLDYPTNKDRDEFKEAKKQGLIPMGVRSPGSAIEIHAGRDEIDFWTEGCVGISYKGMERLMKNLEVGSRVGIIGY